MDDAFSYKELAEFYRKQSEEWHRKYINLQEENAQYKEAFRKIETHLRIDRFIEMHILAEIIEGLEGE